MVAVSFRALNFLPLSKIVSRALARLRTANHSEVLMRVFESHSQIYSPHRLHRIEKGAMRRIVICASLLMPLRRLILDGSKSGG